MATAINNAVIAFGAARAAGTASHIGIHLTSTGVVAFLLGIPISGTAPSLSIGDEYDVAVGDLSIVQGVGTGETEAMAQRGLRGRITGTLFGSLHTADPGLTGANEILLTSRATIAESQWTIT